ncbi:MAG: hypothetical protein QNI95_21155 [Desulfobacterales bacterium]|nr:hypothetical protein [Desulfobacterales bacterium]
MKRIDVPKTLDGAKVLSVTKTETDFGVAGTIKGGSVAIAALVIAQYTNSQKTYLFACDKEWNVAGDLLYASVEDAPKHAERHYKTEPLEWMDVSS